MKQPRKISKIVRKWLNIQSSADEFHSDYTMNDVTGMSGRRRKSCSDDGGCVVVPEELSRSWSMNTSDGIKQPRFEEEGSHLTKNLRFQEIVPLNAGNVLGAEDSGPAAKWLSLIRETLNNGTTDSNASPPPPIQQRVSFSDLISIEDEEEDFERFVSTNSVCFSSEQVSPSPNCTKQNQYCLVASKQMVGLFLCIWVLADLHQRVQNLKVSCVGRGIMGYLGNKGSISISMTLHQTTFCFVCTHLASGEKEGDEVRRNSDVMEILRRTRFNHLSRMGRQSAPHPDKILDHDKIIWLGDLNYRLASGNEEDTFELLKKSDWQALLEKDQLKMEQKAGRVFKGWKEGRIYFPPTYKYLSNSEHYVVQTSAPSKQKQRTPAWCDRILWKGEGLKQICYVRGESKFSDHRPVYSLFLLPNDINR
ncbi:type I inositol polyphosphate 5-phosphatase 8-like isoform X3 [Ipomoea triloba]|uniref:type I inositol polyphosphate 5-phosphatase 8-like isoform X3 n=1 Tax=Ipomoea triloba TaxID=35885 RepID=UPI00125E7261|nr:type I inositol polyphosphate 5-phosphatase 8-like isoform X3 [Ipomoea triloba]